MHIIIITITVFSIMHNMTIQIMYIVLNFITYELGGATLSRSSAIMFTLGGREIKKTYPSLLEMSPFMCRLEMSVILFCLVVILNAETILLPESISRQFLI